MAEADVIEIVDDNQKRLCEDFAAITGTDASLAEYFLREKAWKLEAAVNSYFDGGDPAPVEVIDLEHASMSVSGSSGSSSPDLVVTYESNPDCTAVSTDPSLLKLITWNIDGLDQKNITERTKAVCSIIKRFSPDVVYLQEVIPETFAYIETMCSPTYIAIAGNVDGYFTTVLIKQSRVSLLDHNILQFPTTSMMRNMLTVKAKFANIDLVLMTSHLESTKDHVGERKRQLSTVFKEISEANGTSTVIFGGDTNLRDKEITDVGGFPEGVFDIWEMCGSPADAKFSWDISTNDNLDWSYRNKPKCRFDRLFLRHGATSSKLVPQSFKFIGTERLGCGRFPSDHWGILCEFKVVQ